MEQHQQEWLAYRRQMKVVAMARIQSARADEYANGVLPSSLARSRTHHQQQVPLYKTSIDQSMYTSPPSQQQVNATVPSRRGAASQIVLPATSPPPTMGSLMRMLGGGWTASPRTTLPQPQLRKRPPPLTVPGRRLTLNDDATSESQQLSLLMDLDPSLAPPTLHPLRLPCNEEDNGEGGATRLATASPQLIVR